MPALRRPLQAIDPNSRVNKELTPYKRGKIEGARLVGASWAQIESKLKVPIRTARYTLEKALVRIDAKS